MITKLPDPSLEFISNNESSLSETVNKPSSTPPKLLIIAMSTFILFATTTTFYLIHQSQPPTPPNSPQLKTYHTPYETSQQEILDSSTANWNMYTDEENLYTFKYPNHWSATEGKLTVQPTCKQKLADCLNQTAPYQNIPAEQCQLDISHCPNTSLTISKHPLADMSAINQQYDDEEISDSLPDILKGKGAKVYISYGMYRSKTIYIPLETYLLKLYFSDLYDDIDLQILSTFKFNSNTLSSKSVITLSITPQDFSGNGWHDFKSDKYTTSFQYPPNWQIIEECCDQNRFILRPNNYDEEKFLELEDSIKDPTIYVNFGQAAAEGKTLPRKIDPVSFENWLISETNDEWRISAINTLANNSPSLNNHVYKFSINNTIGFKYFYVGTSGPYFTTVYLRPTNLPSLINIETSGMNDIDAIFTQILSTFKFTE